MATCEKCGSRNFILYSTELTTVQYPVVRDKPQFTLAAYAIVANDAQFTDDPNFEAICADCRAGQPENGVMILYDEDMIPMQITNVEERLEKETTDEPA